MSIATTMADQCRRAWEMCRLATEQIPEEHWRSGEPGYLIPARQLCHVLVAAECYVDSTPDPDRWGEWCDDWLAIPPERMPSPGQVRAYVDEVEAKVAAWLATYSDEQFVEPTNKYPWMGESLLGRVVYLLVHTRQHLGELNAELRRRGLERIPWR